MVLLPVCQFFILHILIDIAGNDSHRKEFILMNKPFTGMIFLLLFILSLSCSGENKEKQTGGQTLKSGKITIVYTGNVGGKINPCGCRIPMGGLARRATVIDNIRKEAQNILVLDSGALLYPSFFMYPPYDFTSRILSHLITEVVNDIGINALNVASYDIANSPDSLLTFDREFPSVWLSANIVWKNSGELVFRPDTTFTVGDFRVGVFGFMDQKSIGVDIFDEKAPVRVLDPVETVKNEVSKLKKDNDLVIALAYMDFEKVKNLVEGISGLNVVIASHTREHSPSSDHNVFQPGLVNNTIIVRCPDGGRVVGRLDLNIANGLTEFIDSEKYVDLRPVSVREKEEPSRQSTYTNTFIDLDPGVAYNPAVKEKIDIFSARVLAYTDSLGLDYTIQ